MTSGYGDIPNNNPRNRLSSVMCSSAAHFIKASNMFGVSRYAAASVLLPLMTICIVSSKVFRQHTEGGKAIMKGKTRSWLSS